MSKSKNAFTIKANGILREIVSHIGVSLPYNPIKDRIDSKSILRSTALWDTGATGSVITKSTAKKLNLIPVSKARVTHAGGESETNVYLVNLYLPNNILFHPIKVTECDDGSGRFGVIIGMDIISCGDFSITNQGGKTIFSFRMPSQHTIDYEK